ncbi:MAG: tetratricopeptide repeat protein [Planctomycetaceae bacterium]|nr:tetratricopeptide repeat protein [Planctomycetaceae bacterium]
MSRIVVLLWFVLLVESFVCGRAVWQRANRVEPPSVALSELDLDTARELQKLQQDTEFGSAENWKHLAEAYLGEGYFPQAEQTFQQAISLNPADEQALYGQAFCLERMGRMERALSIFEQLVDSQDSQLAQTCWYQIGRNRLRLEDPEGAEQAFREIADFPPAAYQLAKLLIRTGHTEEGTAIVEKQLDELPNSLKFKQLLAYAAETSGDRELAWQRRLDVQRAEYQLTLEYGMSYISLFRGKLGLQKQLAACLQLKNSGTLSERADCLDRALAMIEEHDLLNYQSVYVAAAQVALGEGRLEEAFDLLETLHQQEYRTPEVLELEGDIYQQMGDPERARALWLEAVGLVPTSERHEKLAQSFEESGQSEVAHLHEGLALFYRGTNAYRENRLEAAQSLLSKSTQYYPDYTETWYYLGLVKAEQGSLEDARDAWKRCLTLNPEHGRAWEMLEHLKEQDE